MNGIGKISVPSTAISRDFLCTALFITNTHLYIYIYLTIRLRARDFYAVIVDEGEARINYHRIEIESE